MTKHVKSCNAACFAAIGGAAALFITLACGTSAAAAAEITQIIKNATSTRTYSVGSAGPWSFKLECTKLVN